MRSRVIPGSSVTMERRLSVRRLKSVDLPTLGRPTMTTEGSWTPIWLLIGAAQGERPTEYARNSVAHWGGLTGREGERLGRDGRMALGTSGSTELSRDSHRLKACATSGYTAAERYEAPGAY